MEVGSIRHSAAPSSNLNARQGMVSSNVTPRSEGGLCAAIEYISRELNTMEGRLDAIGLSLFGPRVTELNTDKVPPLPTPNSVKILQDCTLTIDRILSIIHHFESNI
jgi:hypothetical protein